MTISKAIDPARVGLSKSLMTSPCERKGFFSETVRDQQGRRLSFPLPERVTFGTAIDEAVTWLLWSIREGRLEYTTDELMAGGEATDVVANDMRIKGLEAASRALGWPLVKDPVTFDVQVRNACVLYLMQPDGLERILALADEGLQLQGNDGESLRDGDVIGTPDFITSRRVGDLKTWGRNDGESKVWKSPEMGIYAALFAAQNGALPETVFYQAYIRVSKPYWTWIEVPATSALVAYGRETAAHWRGLLEIGRPELFPVNTQMCGDCPFRAPLPEYGHEGCIVGHVAPAEEVAA